MNIKLIAKMSPVEFVYKLNKTVHAKFVMKNHDKMPYEKYCNKYLSYHHSKIHNQVDF